MPMDDQEYVRIRQYVVEPLVQELRSEMKALQQAILTINEKFERQFQQHDRMLTSTEAAMRNASDPTTGSITRSELRLLQEAADKEHEEIREAINDARQDHETRLRTLERNLAPPWLWPILSVIIGVASTFISHFVWK